MNTIWTKDIRNNYIPIRNLGCFNDDGFGNIIETAGSYYTENPTHQLLHKDMMIANYAGAVYFVDASYQDIFDGKNQVMI